MGDFSSLFASINSGISGLSGAISNVYTAKASIANLQNQNAQAKLQANLMQAQTTAQIAALNSPAPSASGALAMPAPKSNAMLYIGGGLLLVLGFVMLRRR